MAKSRSPLFAGVTGSFGDFVVVQVNGHAVLRAKPGPRRKRSDLQADCRFRHRERAGMWKALPKETQRKWGLLGLQMTDWERKRATDGLSGYLTFQSVNAWRRVLSLPDVAEPEAAPVFPPSLCPVSLTNFTLTSGGFDGPVQVYAAPPALPNGVEPRENQFAVLCLLPGLPDGAYDLQSALFAKYGSDWNGAQVWVKLTPVSEAGFAGRTVTKTAVVGAA